MADDRHKPLHTIFAQGFHRRGKANHLRTGLRGYSGLGRGGPFFGFSETWQLVVNTSTTIITFLMVFILQNTQNRDGEAIQAKLDELILASAAENKFIGAEKLSAKELEQLRALVRKAASSADAHLEKKARAR